MRTYEYSRNVLAFIKLVSLVLLTSVFLLTFALPSAEARLRDPTTLELFLSSSTVYSEDPVTLTATLTSRREPLANKTIEFSTTNGSIDPNIGTTNSEGKVSVTYTAPKVSLRTSATITATFAGGARYKSSTASASVTVKARPEVPTLATVKIRGASFAIPETMKDDISSYKAEAAVPEWVPIPIPTTGFLLAKPEELYLVLSKESDKGMATVEGWPLPENINLAGYNLNVILAENVSFEKEGTPATVGEILSNPIDFRLELVKVRATRRHVSILYDPDDGSGIEFPVTAGYLVEEPKEVKSTVKEGIKKGKEIVRNPDRQTIKKLLSIQKTRLPVFDFETDYWLSSPAETDGIVLSSGSKVISLLQGYVPLENLMQLDEGKPVLYDVKTNLMYEEVSSVSQIKENPVQYRGKVVGFTAKSFGGGISIQETWEGLPPCGPEKVRIRSACIDILVDVRLEGLVAWNMVSVPPGRADFLLTAGASSIHRDEPYKKIEGRFKYVGKVRSTKEISSSLPEAMVLVIYERDKVGDIDYKTMAERSEEIIENQIGELDFGLTGFIEGVPPGIPVKFPRISVAKPEELPETISLEKAMVLNIQRIKPETLVELKITKSVMDGLTISVKEEVSDVEISIKKLPTISPEIGVEPFGEVYKAIDISAANLPEDSIENAEIAFWVSKEYLQTHDFGKDDVILQRFHAGGWENLLTTQIDENASHFKYSAQTPGFSTFAITASARAPSTPTKPTKPEKGISPEVIAGIIVAIVVIIGTMAYLRRKS